MARTLDEILGITKTQTPHDFKLNERVVTNKHCYAFHPGRQGTVVDFDQYNLPQVRLDILPNKTFWFHPSQLDRI